MPDNPLEIRFDTEYGNRRALLEEAASDVDDLVAAHIGGGGAARGPTDEGKLVRDLVTDQASLSYPLVYPVTDKAFLNRATPVPFSKLKADYNFYWIQFPVGLFPQNGWAFNQLRMKIEFNEGAAPHTRPKAYAILPDKKFQILLDAHSSLEVRLDENFEFEAKKVPIPLPAGAGAGNASVDVNGAAQLGLFAGPFHYRIVKAQIDHTNTGLEWVGWQLNDAQFVQQSLPDLVVIAEVPKETKEVQVTATMQAHRYFNLLGNDIRVLFMQLKPALKSFFMNGLPTEPCEATYDLTPKL